MKSHYYTTSVITLWRGIPSRALGDMCGCTGLLAAEQEEIIYGAGECLRSLVVSCVDQGMVHQGCSRLSQPGQGAPSVMERICASAESMLGYQYSTAWDMALHVVSALFDRLGRFSCC